MAIKKQIGLENGFSVEYHRIKKVELNKDGSGVIMVESFKDSASRENGKNAVKVSFKLAPANTFNIIIDITWETAYEYIKTLPEYINSENI